MTDETKLEVMTAERMEEIRERALRCASLASPAVPTFVLAGEDVPALLSALEEARGDVDAGIAREEELSAKLTETTDALEEARDRRDDGLSSLATMAEHRDALAKELDEERFERFRREKNTGKALAEVAASRDALAARVAELEAGQAALIRESAESGAVLMRKTERIAELEGALAKARTKLGGLGWWERGGPIATCSDCGHPAHVAGQCPGGPTDEPEDGTKCACLSAAPPEKAPALPWPVTADAMHACSLSFPDVESGTIDNVCGCFTIAECLADSLEKVTCLACLREIARQRAPKNAPVMVHCSPRVAERAAACGPVSDLGIGYEFVTKLVANAMAPAADPLCARVLPSGQKCGHLKSRHVLLAIPGPSLPAQTICLADGATCPCPGFVPEPSPRMTDAQQRDAAALMAATEPAPPDGPGIDPDMDAAPSGVGDGGTAARKHWPDCALNHGGSECDMGPDCGSTTEGGEGC